MLTAFPRLDDYGAGRGRRHRRARGPASSCTVARFAQCAHHESESTRCASPKETRQEGTTRYAANWPPFSVPWHPTMEIETGGFSPSASSPNLQMFFLSARVEVEPAATAGNSGSLTSFAKPEPLAGGRSPPLTMTETWSKLQHSRCGRQCYPAVPGTSFRSRHLAPTSAEHDVVDCVQSNSWRFWSLTIVKVQNITTSTWPCSRSSGLSNMHRSVTTRKNITVR